MTIGIGIALLIIGVILSFAFDVKVGWFNLYVVGYTVMGLGFLVLVVGVARAVVRRGKAADATDSTTSDDDAGPAS
ncbi:MAG: hypothetical protein ACK5IN_08840 [Microbacterium sp.]|uniref:hypothetical protein n=1 Tax=Microbacterium sp. TaxID=51671 RepID=UPI003A850266